MDELTAVLDGLCATDATALADGEIIVELYRCMSRLEAVATKASAAFDAGGEWAAEGARSAPAWLAVSTKAPKSSAARRVRLGRALRDLPAAEAAWLAGAVDGAQVAALAAARTPVTAEVMARDEEMLVGQAAGLRHDQFAQVLSYWSQHADPDGTEDTAAKQRDGRFFNLSRGLGGSWVGNFEFDPISGAVFDNALRRIEAELFAEDWAEAKERMGGDVRPSDLARTPRQRRADAATEMARRAMSAPEGGRRPEPLFTVLVDYETFSGRICQLADGTVVSPGSLLHWLDEAWVERIVFDGPSRVKDVGVTRRLFEGATRRAVEAMFPECFHKFCDMAAERCEVDHVEPYGAGGLTVSGNGRMACGYHNRRRHRGPGPPARDGPPPRT